LGSQADLPVNVAIVGSVLSLDGEELKGLDGRGRHIGRVAAIALTFSGGRIFTDHATSIRTIRLAPSGQGSGWGG
jgi:hypothetical protein